jgi:hypothetical protein
MTLSATIALLLAVFIIGFCIITKRVKDGLDEIIEEYEA